MNKKLLKFSARWCGPCKALTALFDDEKEVFDKAGVEVQEIDIDNHANMAKDYDVRAVPYLVLLDSENQVLKTHTGTLDVKELEEFVA
jgi:thioredoxin 1